MISINIKDKIATVEGSPVIVCGNSDYEIRFAFDDEWTDKTTKTARFVYLVNGQRQYQDVVFTGDTVSVPVLANTDEVAVGVFAGELSTTTPALIPCKRSIRCGTGAPADPTPDQYDQIMAAMAGLAPRDKWITIVNTTTEDGAQEIATAVDVNGNPFECKMVRFHIVLPSNLPDGSSLPLGFICGNAKYIPAGIDGGDGQGYFEFEVEKDLFCTCAFYSAASGDGLYGRYKTSMKKPFTDPSFCTDNFKQVSVWPGDGLVFPTGTIIKIWGLKV